MATELFWIFASLTVEYDSVSVYIVLNNALALILNLLFVCTFLSLILKLNQSNLFNKFSLKLNFVFVNTIKTKLLIWNFIQTCAANFLT